MSTDTGKPAFPVPLHANAVGMTLRDYFAALALSGLGAESGMEDDLAGYAAWAYRMADHMLIAREL